LASANTFSNKDNFAATTLGAIRSDNTDAILVVARLLTIERKLVTSMGFGYISYFETANLVSAIPI
jgi:hypothetical protein